MTFWVKQVTLGVEESIARSVECVAQFHVCLSLGLGEAAAFGSCRGGDAWTTPEAVPESLSPC